MPPRPASRPPPGGWRGARRVPECSPRDVAALPTLIHAAVASSAPVRAVAAFGEQRRRRGAYELSATEAQRAVRSHCVWATRSAAAVGTAAGRGRSSRSSRTSVDSGGSRVRAPARVLRLRRARLPVQALPTRSAVWRRVQRARGVRRAAPWTPAPPRVAARGAVGDGVAESERRPRSHGEGRLHLRRRRTTPPSPSSTPTRSSRPRAWGSPRSGSPAERPRRPAAGAVDAADGARAPPLSAADCGRRCARSSDSS